MPPKKDIKSYKARQQKRAQTIAKTKITKPVLAPMPEKQLLPKEKVRKHAELFKTRSTVVSEMLKGKEKILPPEVIVPQEEEDAELAALIDEELKKDEELIHDLKEKAKETREIRKKQLEAWEKKERAPPPPLYDLPKEDIVGTAVYKNVHGVKISKPIYRIPIIYPRVSKGHILNAFKTFKAKQRQLFKELSKQPKSEVTLTKGEIEKIKAEELEEGIREIEAIKPPLTEAQKKKEIRHKQEMELESSILEEFKAKEWELIEDPPPPEVILTKEALKELDKRAEEVVDIEGEEMDDEEKVPEELIIDETYEPSEKTEEGEEQMEEREEQMEEEEEMKAKGISKRETEIEKPQRIREEEEAPPLPPPPKNIPIVTERWVTKYKETTFKTMRFGQPISYTLWEKLQHPEVEYKQLPDIETYYPGYYNIIIGANNVEIPWKLMDRHVLVIDSKQIRKRKPFIGRSYLKPLGGIYISKKAVPLLYTDPIPSSVDLLKEPVSIETREYTKEYIKNVMKALVISTGIKREMRVERKGHPSKPHLSFEEFRTIHFNRFRVFKIRNALRNDELYKETLNEKVDDLLDISTNDMAGAYIETIKMRFGILKNEDELLNAITNIEVPSLFDILIIKFLNNRNTYKILPQIPKIVEIPDLNTIEGMVSSAFYYFNAQYPITTEEELRKSLDDRKNKKYSTGKHMYKLTNLESSILKFLNARHHGKILYAEPLHGSELNYSIRKIIRHNIKKGGDDIPKTEIDSGYEKIVHLHKVNEEILKSLTKNVVTYNDILTIIHKYISLYINIHPTAFTWKTRNDVINELVSEEISKRMKTQFTTGEMDEFNSSEYFEYEKLISKSILSQNRLYGGKNLLHHYNEYEKAFLETKSEILTLEEYRARKLEEYMYALYVSTMNPLVSNTQTDINAMRRYLIHNPLVSKRWEQSFENISLIKYMHGELPNPMTEKEMKHYLIDNPLIAQELEQSFEQMLFDKYIYTMYVEVIKPPSTNTQTYNKELMKQYLNENPQIYQEWKKLFEQLSLDAYMYDTYIENVDPPPEDANKEAMRQYLIDNRTIAQEWRDIYEQTLLDKYMYSMYLSIIKSSLTNTQSFNKEAMNKWIADNPSAAEKWKTQFELISTDEIDREYKVIEHTSKKVEESSIEWLSSDIDAYELALFEQHKDSTQDYLNESSIHIMILSNDPLLSQGYTKVEKAPGTIIRERIINGYMQLKEIVGMQIEDLFIEVFMNKEITPENKIELIMHISKICMILVFSSIAYIAAIIYPTSKIRIMDIYPMILPSETPEEKFLNFSSYAVIPQSTCYPNREDINDGELVLIRDEETGVYNCFSYKQLFYLIKRAGNELPQNPYKPTSTLPLSFVNEFKVKFSDEIQKMNIDNPLIKRVKWDNKRTKESGKWVNKRTKESGEIDIATGERVGKWEWHDINGKLIEERVYHSLGNGIVRVETTKY